MGLDVEVPDPPQLTNRGVPSEFESVEAVGGAGDLRREELEGILMYGAWNEAFEEWAAYTEMTEEEFGVVGDLDLIQQLDVFWDPEEEHLRFEPPTVPEDWRDRTPARPTDSADLVTRLEGELADLGQTLVDMLEDGYLDWGDEEATDYVWSEETFGHGTQE